MRKVTLQPSDDLVKELREERAIRKTENLPETITAILRDYFKMPKLQELKKLQLKKSKIQKIIEHKNFRRFIVIIYILLMFTILVNIADWSIPVLNVEYFTVNNPTDYTFLQTYPPSIDGYQIRLENETITFQVHIHANTIIKENTNVNIEAEAGVGNSFSNNMSALGVGFYGANYISSEQTVFQIPNGNKYELWSGWAGERLYPNTSTQSMLVFVPHGGVAYGGTNATVRE